MNTTKKTISQLIIVLSVAIFFLTSCTEKNLPDSSFRKSAVEPVKPETIGLWPQKATLDDGNNPTLTVFSPPANTACGTAVIICPGGGYTHLATEHEGRQVGQWLNRLGTTGFMLKYRHAGTGHDIKAAMQDIQRAIRIVRSGAERWHLDPNRIGVLGFSAGGHLASTAGTLFDKKLYEPADSIDRQSSRPDFMILVYPLINITEKHIQQDHWKKVIGPGADAEFIKLLSSENQVTPGTPPAFLVHAADDPVVSEKNSIAFYEALKKAQIPAEMHIFEKGGHGFGLGKSSEPVSAWPSLCENWMRNRGLCGSQKTGSIQPK